MNNLLYYALISSLATGGNYFFNVIHARKFVKFDLFHIELKKHLKPVLLIALIIFLSSIYSKIDVTMLNVMATDESVGYYTYAQKTVNMLALPEIKRTGISSALRNFGIGLENNPPYRWKFIFFIYLFMVLSRTLICRNIWQSPWENVIGEWGIYTSEGKFNIEGLLNIVLFCPLIFFGLLGFHSYIKRKYSQSKRIVLFILKYSLAFSSSIEVCQLFLRLGTFQLSDIAQNTFGGIIGAILYLVVEKIKSINRKRGKNK